MILVRVELVSSKYVWNALVQNPGQSVLKKFLNKNKKF